MNKRIILFLKIAIFLGIIGFLVRAIYQAATDALNKAQKAHIPLNLGTLDWRYGLLAVSGFVGVMLVSSLTWRWLAWQMGDRSPTVRMVGAYCFSQMGKYIPGKIALLLMRIERAGRFGMTAGTCTLSTLQENALYIISGAFTGMLAMTHISDALPPKFHLVRAAIWPASIGVIAILGAACHPRVFYGLVGALLKKMKKPSIAPEQKLGEVTLLLGVLAFVPCWAFGGFALWASTCTLHVVPIGDCFWFIGAFSLSVIIGMISFLPGGTGIREAVLGIAVMLQLSRSGMDHDQAVLIGALVAVVQRVCQIAAELLVGIAGAVLTRRSAATAEISAPGGATVGG